MIVGLLALVVGVSRLIATAEAPVALPVSSSLAAKGPVVPAVETVISGPVAVVAISGPVVAAAAIVVAHPGSHLRSQRSSRKLIQKQYRIK
jgi:hypothetical protein